MQKQCGVRCVKDLAMNGQPCGPVREGNPMALGNQYRDLRRHFPPQQVVRFREFLCCWMGDQQPPAMSW
jgi:hypothetical protein